MMLCKKLKIPINPIKLKLLLLKRRIHKMKKILMTLFALFTVFCLSVNLVQIKWQGQQNAGVGGHFGQITIDL